MTSFFVEPIQYDEDIWDECEEELPRDIYTTKYSTFIECSPRAQPQGLARVLCPEGQGTSNDVSNYDKFVHDIISRENESAETSMALNPEEFEDESDEHSLGARGYVPAGSGRDAKHPAAFSFGKRALSRRAAHQEEKKEFLDSTGRIMELFNTQVGNNLRVGYAMFESRVSPPVCYRMTSTIPFTLGMVLASYTKGWQEVYRNQSTHEYTIYRNRNIDALVYNGNSKFGVVRCPSGQCTFSEGKRGGMLCIPTRASGDVAPCP
jgi:hypothetical protein